MTQAANTLQTWTQLIIAALGIVGTLGAALGSQWWQSRAVERRMAHERELERERWERDERRQLRNERRTAYADFLESADTFVSKLSETPLVANKDDLNHLVIRLERVRLIASPDLTAAAEQLVRMVGLMVTNLTDEGGLGKHEFPSAVREFLRIARRDLGIDDRPTPEMLLTKSAE